MLVIYNFLISISVIFLKVFSIFNRKLKLGIKGRQGWERYLQGIPRDKNIYWFHCASLGEFDQGLPLMNLIKKKDSENIILVTFFSPSGFCNFHKRQNPVDFALYLPFDSRKNARKFFTILKPKLGIFVKYEFWPNFLHQAVKHNITIVSLATLLRTNQVYFKWYGSLFRTALKKVHYFFVQNENTASLLHKLRLNNFEVIGDTRFDRVIENKHAFERNKLLSSTEENLKFEKFLEGEKAIIFGSSWSTEEEILFAFLTLNKKTKIILAPHDVSESNVLSIIEKLGANTVRYTEFDTKYVGQQVMILDTIGQLATAYSYGSVAFIGGGFSGKLHNILEPAVFGLPVFFGPNHKKFPEAEDFLKKGIGFSVKNVSEFEKKLLSINQNMGLLSEKIIQHIESQRGASEKVIKSLEKSKLI